MSKSKENGQRVGEPDGMENLKDANFPFSSSPEAKLRFLLRYAILAPSNRNSQPWRWQISGDTAELYADRMRALPYVDPDDRELMLSCGAALMNLRVAIGHFGHSCNFQLLPDHTDPDLLALVRLGEAQISSGDDDLLFEAITRRHTNRHPFLERDLPDTLQGILKEEARREGAQLFFIEDVEERLEIINLIVRGDQEQGADPQFLQETTTWIRPNRFESSDGIPQIALGGGMGSRFTRDIGAAQADKNRMLAWSAPALAVLETTQDSPRAWLEAGQALERVLLRAGAEGVQASFFNSPIEIVDMWPKLHEILKHAGLPQMILRLGYPAQDSSPTPRRSISEVTRHHNSTGGFS
jgi:nitroreductase